MTTRSVSFVAEKLNTRKKMYFFIPCPTSIDRNLEEGNIISIPEFGRGGGSTILSQTGDQQSTPPLSEWFPQDTVASRERGRPHMIPAEG